MGAEARGEKIYWNPSPSGFGAINIFLHVQMSCLEGGILCVAFSGRERQAKGNLSLLKFIFFSGVGKSVALHASSYFDVWLSSRISRVLRPRRDMKRADDCVREWNSNIYLLINNSECNCCWEIHQQRGRATALKADTRQSECVALTVDEDEAKIKLSLRPLILLFPPTFLIELCVGWWQYGSYRVEWSKVLTLTFSHLKDL